MLYNTNSCVCRFSVFFLAFYSINTQNPYSTPPLSEGFPLYQNGSIIPNSIAIGPIPNSTNVRLDTSIVIYQVRPAGISNLSLTPETPMLSIKNENQGMASLTTTLYPTIPLKPSTAYNVSLLYGTFGEHYSWVFTTTSEPFKPDISYYLVTYSFWIALTVALCGSTITFILIRRTKSNTPPF